LLSRLKAEKNKFNKKAEHNELNKGISNRAVGKLSYAWYGGIGEKTKFIV